MKGNALIESTMLGCEDHGIMTCYLTLNQDGSCQGFGGYGLDDYSKKEDKRIESIICGFWIRRILEVVGVDSWEKLKGKHIRVDGEDYGKIYGIGHITANKWFYPEKETKLRFKELFDKE